jgi:putative transposase
MARVVPSERFRRELDEVLADVDGETDPVERIARLGARLILQQALEDEVTEFLGQLRYERATDPVSHRNGYEPWTGVPQLVGIRRGRGSAFDLQIVGLGVSPSRILVGIRFA